MAKKSERNGPFPIFDSREIPLHPKPIVTEVKLSAGEVMYITACLFEAVKASKLSEEASTTDAARESHRAATSHTMQLYRLFQLFGTTGHGITIRPTAGA